MEKLVLDRTALRASGGSVLRRFTRTRRNLRLSMYSLIASGDIFAILVAFRFGLGVHNEAGQGILGIDLVWFVAAFHVTIGILGNAYSYTALQSRLESIHCAWRSFLFAIALTCMIMFFYRAGAAIPRLDFAAASIGAMLLIAVLRAGIFSIVGPGDNWMVGELLIIDGGPIPRDFVGELVDASVIGLAPDVGDPVQLGRLAEEIASFDRVVVSCSSEQRRSEWAQMLKCYQVTGEVMLSESSPLGAVAVARFRGQDTLVVSRGALSLGNRLRKRAMDLAISLAALFVLAPMLAIVAIAIKLDSKGTVLFAQPRVGRDNRMFQIYKFRSMRSEVCDLAGNRSTSRDDDRITRVGRFIRATSIDELPQLFNVVLGDMSIVGPRPHALGSQAGNQLFWEVDSTYWQRHKLKPGITGLAQVRGFRGATHNRADLENRLQADLEYVSGWSLWRDVKILISTIRVVIHPHAY